MDRQYEAVTTAPNEYAAKQQQRQSVDSSPYHAGSLTALLGDQRGAVVELHGTIDELEMALENVLFHHGEPTSISGGKAQPPTPATSTHGATLGELTDRINEASRRLRGLASRVAA